MFPPQLYVGDFFVKIIAMGLLKTFYPNEKIASAYDIDYKGFFDKGIRGVIFDIDNTLVPHGFPADEKAIELFNSLHLMGIKTVLLSNNKRPRVESFAHDVNSDFIYKANKPARSGYLNAMNIMNTDINSTIFVGDQLFTDVWGAKRTGMHSILTSPINPKEEIQIVLKRYLEKIVLYYYEKEFENK